MSVVIKGMDMPDSCRHCCMMTGTFCDVLNIGVDPYGNGAKHRDDWCPLVELPEKHGKLIDGIELINYCKDMIRLSRENDEDMRYIIISKICYNSVIGEIINMPTLLEAEGEE